MVLPFALALPKCVYLPYLGHVSLMTKIYGLQPVFDIGGYPAVRVREFHLQTKNVVHYVGPDVQKFLK